MSNEPVVMRSKSTGAITKVLPEFMQTPGTEGCASDPQESSRSDSFRHL